MKKHIIFVGALVIILSMFYRQNDSTSNKKSTINTNSIVSDSSIEKKETFYKGEDSSEVKLSSLDEYIQLTLQEKEILFTRCIGYSGTNKNVQSIEKVEVIDVNKVIKDYLVLYKKSTGKELTNKQIKVLEAMYERCNILYGKESNIYNEITANTSNFLEELEILEQDNSKEKVRNLASKYLLDIDEKTRLDAIAYLMDDEEWIYQINKDLGFKGLELDKIRKYINEAFETIACEQGFRNCNANSEMMSQICLMIPEACGLNFDSFQRMMVSDYDWNIITKYKEYFYTYYFQLGNE